MRRLMLLLVLLVLPVSVSAQPQILNNLLAQITTWDSTYMGYITGDLVKSGNSIFICVAAASNCIGPGKSPTDEASGWRSMAGVQAWNSTVPYAAGQMVTRTSNNSLFTALRPNMNEDPVGNPTVWQLKGVASVPTFVPAGATTAQIQDAITNTPVGGVVQFDCSTFTITSSITINKAMTLLGCNSRGTRINIADGVAAFQHLPGGGNPPGPLIVNRMGFFGGAIAVQMGDASQDSSVNECYFSQQTTAGAQFVGGASRWSVYHSTFESCSKAQDAACPFVTAPQYGIQIASSSDNVEATIHGNLFVMPLGSLSSVESDGSGDLRVVNNKFLGCAQHEMHFLNTGISTSELIFVGNVVSAHGLGHYGILIDPTAGLGALSIAGNQINGGSATSPGFNCPGSLASSIKITGGHFGNVVISGNQFGDDTSVATIDLDQVDHANVSGNGLVRNGGSGAGIRVGAATTNTFIFGNQFDGYGTNISGTGGAGTAIGVTSGTCRNGIVISGSGC